MIKHPVEVYKIFEANMNKINFKENSKVNVMVSGGSDSMCLLDCAEKYFSSKNIQLEAIYINFKDFPSYYLARMFVSSYCYKFNIKLKIKESEINENSGKSVKLLARSEMKKYALENRPDYVLTGHNLDDNVETVLYRFLSGRAGVKGLRGMKEVDEQVFGGIKSTFIKPLLNIRKEDLRDYCLMCGIDFVDDETNFEILSDRNYIRNVLMPLIRLRFNDKSMLNFSKRLENYINELEDEKLVSKDGYWNLEDFQSRSLNCRLNSVIEKCKEFGYVLSSKHINGLKKFLESDRMEKRSTGIFKIIDINGYCLFLVWGKISNKICIMESKIEE